MSTIEVAPVFVDTVQAQLVECAPDPEIPVTPLPAPPEHSPVEQAQHATIEQTGAGPPRVTHG